MQVHGTADQIVNFKWGEGTHKQLQEFIPSPAPQFLQIAVSKRVKDVVICCYKPNKFILFTIGCNVGCNLNEVGNIIDIFV